MKLKSLLIVGGDRMDKITEKLESYGIKQIIHINGRKVQMVRREIPEQVDAVLVITDYVNHNLANVIKQKAKNKALPTYFSRRSWGSIQQVVEKVI